MKKFIVFDGNSILNRAFYGVRSLSTKDGLPTNAVFGFINIINKSISSLGEKPGYAAIAFDLRAKTFRHLADPSYKANRKGMPEELAVQLPFAREVSEALGLVLLEREGYEADDILGTLSRVAKERACGCVIVTGDRDSLQLTGGGTEVHLAATNETKIYTEDRIKEEYGVTPKQLIDVKAIMGDSSDNIAGVPGVGEKGALKLIAEYGTLAGVYENIDKINGSLRDKLLAGKESAFNSRFLAEICLSVPIPENLEEYAYTGGDVDKLTGIYKKLEFKQLSDKLEKDRSGVREEVFIYKDSRLADFIALAEQNSLFAHIGDGLLTVRGGESLLQSRLDETFAPLFNNKNFSVAVWSLKDTKTALRKYGIEFTNCSDDLSLMCYILSPADSGVGFEKAAFTYLGRSVRRTEAAYFPALAEILGKKISENGQGYLYRDIELRLASVLADMEKKGFSVDADGLEAYSGSLSEWIKTAEAQIYGAAGRTFNLNSPKQLGAVLFDELLLPRGRKIKSGYSTDADTLEKLRFAHPEIIEPILYHRKLTKLKSTYADGLLKEISADDGRIHTTFKQTQTLTGRLSSAEPNLQNIPVRQEPGRELRRFFNAPAGYLLIDADYSQIELRILAHISGDENLTAAFLNGEDIHSLTASQIFGVPLESVTKQMRNSAKAVNFGIVYGIGEFSLSDDIGVSRKEAKAYIDGYFAKYPGVKEYMDKTVALAHETGYVATIFGRRRYIPELSSPKKPLRSFGERAAMNTPIQGTAADIIKKAMIDAQNGFINAGLQTRLILQVHDELIAEAPESEAAFAQKILVQAMENAVKLTVPLSVDVKTGKNWFEAKEGVQAYINPKGT